MVQSFDENDIVLVTGATGFTGSFLVKELCKMGVTVRAIVRASSNREQLQKLPIQWFEGDVFDRGTIKHACQNVSYVFHVAAAYREAKISNEVYHNVHVKSTQYLAMELRNNKKLKRFVHISTVGVHGHIDNPPADEEYRFAPGDEYQKTKIEAELWLRDYAKDNVLPITVIRPAAIYGPGDKRLLKVFKLAKLPITPIFGLWSKGLYHLIHVEDLVRFMLLAARHEKTHGEVYICGNPKAETIKGIVKQIAALLGKKAKFARLPATPLYGLGWLCEILFKPLGIEPPIYRRRVAFFTKDRSFNTNKMTDGTGFVYKYSNEEGIQGLVEWYVQEGWL